MAQVTLPPVRHSDNQTATKSHHILKLFEATADPQWMVHYLRAPYRLDQLDLPQLRRVGQRDVIVVQLSDVTDQLDVSASFKRIGKSTCVRSK